MFAGNCRDSAGGFLQYLQGKPCNIYRFTKFAGKICIYYRVFPAHIACTFAENPCRVPAIPCKHLQYNSQWSQKLVDLNIKHILFYKQWENSSLHFRYFSWKENWDVYHWIIYCHLTGLWTFKNRLTHTQLNVCEKEELPSFNNFPKVIYPS